MIFIFANIGRGSADLERSFSGYRVYVGGSAYAVGAKEFMHDIFLL